MAKRQREWARKQRNQLHFLLGNKCHKCSATEKLQLDCKIPQGDEHHDMEWSARMSFYRREYFRGNLQLSCETCNGSKGATTDKTFYAMKRLEQKEQQRMQQNLMMEVA
jgi:5-methylcytosine-specific restriction endonuclease McrA